MIRDMKILTFLILTILGSFLMAGCVQDQDPSTEPDQENRSSNMLEMGSYEDSVASVKSRQVQQFSDEKDLADFVAKYQNSGSSFYGYRGGVAETMDANVAASASGGDAAQQQSTDYSKTNVQEAGIDEADIVKTDGNYIYTITDRTVFVVEAYPGEEAQVVSRIQLNNTPEGLFLYEDTLAVFGQLEELDKLREADISPTTSASFLQFYDVAAPAELQLSDEFFFEGRYEQGRMVDGVIYLGVMSTPELRDRPMPYYVAEGNRQHVAPGAIHYYDVPYQNPGFATLHSISIAESSHLDAASVAVEQNRELYMSDENIYLTYERTVSEYDLQMDILKDLLKDELSSRDRELITKIKQTDDAVLSRSEKQQKIQSIYQSYMQAMNDEEQDSLEERARELVKEKIKEMEHLQYTAIHRVAVDEGELEVEANGEVPGEIINQFAMDEHDDVLRIATTLDDRWSSITGNRTESTNNVYTLDQDLEIMGSLEGLAKDEEIYSTRFVGEKLYMVTFREIDPFFVIDLSNPEDIVNEGELKITGFSRYLHPYDEDTIIGIGKAATREGRSLGVKVSLFDVSNVSNPDEIASYTTESDYSNSNVLYEHKAFLFDREKNLLVLPAHSYERRFWGPMEEKNSGERYNGAMVFNITDSSVSLRGLIDHSTEGGNYYQPSVERSLYIEDLLYTKSPNLLRINALDDLHGVKNISLKSKEESPDIPVY